MAGSDFDLTGSRLQNASRVNQANEDADVADWPKANDFILCAMIESTAHAGGAGTLQLRWRNVTDSGSFVVLSGTGELTWSGTTNLVNGNAVASGEEVCTPTSGSTRIDGVEREGANDVSTTHAQNEFCEHQWAIDSSGGVDGKQYEFEIYDATEGAAVGTCLAQITTLSANVNIAASTDALTLTEIPATVNAETNVNAVVDDFMLTTFAATINAETNIQAGVDALTVTDFTASITLPVNVSANVDALTFTEFAATINAETNVQASVDALTLTTFAASVSLGVVVNASVDSLTITEFAATVNAATNVQASVAPLTLTEFAAVVNAGNNIQVSIDALTLTAFQATITLGGDTNVLAGVDVLTLTEFAATIAAGGVAASVAKHQQGQMAGLKHMMGM